jgi:hypothetical protein
MRSNFRTTYCHMTYENSKQKQIAVRLDMVRYAQKHGVKPAGRKFRAGIEKLDRRLSYKNLL